MLNFTGKSEGKGLFEEFGVDWNVVLKFNFKKYFLLSVGLNKSQAFTNKAMNLAVSQQRDFLEDERTFKEDSAP